MAVREIASLSRHHLLRHQNTLFRNNPRSCARCSSALGATTPLPPNCLRRAIEDNMRRHESRCLCLSSELARRSVAHINLLMIDAEGHDDQVIRAFPFGAVRVDRVVFEAVHMPNARFRAVASHLRSFGFEHVKGVFKDYESTWHRIDAK